MQEMASSFFEEYAKIGKALSNKNRLEILSLLLQSKKTVETLSKNTGLSIANVSKHLQVLLKARMVINEKYKNYIFYQIANPMIVGLITHYFEVAHKQIEAEHLLVDDFLHSEMETISITFEEMEEKMTNQEIFLIDVRPEEEYGNAHIPGAISMPIEELEKHIALLPKDRTIVAYCRGPHCLLSSEAIEILERHGHSAIRLTQRIADWKKYQKENVK